MKLLMVFGFAITVVTTAILLWPSSENERYDEPLRQQEISIDGDVGTLTPSQSLGIDASNSSFSDNSGNDFKSKTTDGISSESSFSINNDSQTDTGNGSRIIAQDRMRELRDEIRRADKLPAENKFVRNDNIDAQLSSELLKSGGSEYENLLNEMNEQSWDDPLANELTDLYRNYMQNNFDTEEFDFSVDRLQCGLRTCAGRAITDSDQWQHHFDQMGIGENDLPLYTVVQYSHELQNGLLEYRFLFSIDPDSNGITLSLNDVNEPIVIPPPGG